MPRGTVADPFPAVSADGSLTPDLGVCAGVFRSACAALSRHLAEDAHARPLAPLLAAAGQWIELLERLAAAEPATTELGHSELSELIHYGLDLSSRLDDWCERLGLREAHEHLAGTPFPLALWSARQGAELMILEPVVDNFALLADRAQDSGLLRALAAAAGEIIAAAAPAVRRDLEAGNPARPWRLLHLSRASVALRSGDRALMRAALEDLCTRFADEAGALFTEGLRQAERQNLPAQTRELLQQYAARARIAPGPLH